MKRKLLLAMMVAVIVCCAMSPANASTAKWTKANYAKNLLDSLDDSFDYGVIAEEYTQYGHSEANIYVDALTKSATDPILASMTFAPTYALVTLPTGHTADSMTFGLYDGNTLITTQTVDVAGKTQVFVTFPANSDYNQYAGKELTIRQIRDDNSTVEENGINDDQLTVNYGDPVSASGSTGSYIGSFVSTPQDFKMFNMQTAQTLTLGKYLLYLKYDYNNFMGGSSQAYTWLSSFSGQSPKTDRNGKLYYSLNWGGFGGSMNYYPVISKTQNGKSFSELFYAKSEGWYQTTYYKWQDLLYCHSDQKFYMDDYTTAVTVNYTDDTTLASKRLEKLAELSVSLANSDLGLGGRALSLGTIPSADGNSTVTTDKSGNGTVVSLYQVNVGSYVGSEGKNVYYIDRGSLLPENSTDQATEVYNKGLPLAANEYAVMNVVVPDGVDSITLNSFGITLKNSDGTKDIANVSSWRAGNAQNFNRIIWNFVTYDETTGTYQPYTGTVYTGSDHGGMVLVPNGTIVNNTGDAVTLVAKSVTSNGEVHHNSATPSSTTVTMRSSIPAEISISVTKKWDDNNNRYGNRPESVTVTLVENGTTTNKTVTLNADNNWTASFTGLDSTKTYTVKEEAVPGYTSTVTGTAATGFTITNTLNTIDISGIKTWVDGDNQDGIRPPTVKVVLTGTVAGSTVYEKAQTISADSNGNWKYTFTDLPEYDSGKKITYTVSEVDVEGYTSTVSGYNLTNTHIPETLTISGTKTWNDGSNQDARPASITITLTGTVNGTTVSTATKTVTADDNWAYSFADLPKYKDGKGITYTISEAAVNGYTATYDGYNVTNTLDTVDISVTKEWVDGDNQGNTRPTSITITLSKDVGDGVVPVTNKTVSASDDWACAFTDLPKYDSNGNEITYYVTDSVTGYTTIPGTKGNNYTITNTLVTDISGQKTWIDDEDKAKKRPEEITVNLLQLFGSNYDLVDSQTVSADDDWAYKFENLPKYDEDGNEITYAISEEEVSGYIATYDGYNITNTYTDAKITISGSKTWDDNNDQDGKRPAAITVTLTGTVDGTTVSTATKSVTAADGWAYSFADLPKYKDGKEITYTISENAVENYSTSINGYNITNSYTPEKLTISGSKTWDDNNDQDGKRPAAITVTLTGTVDGTTVSTATKSVTATDGWAYSFADLLKYKDGKAITYTISENAVENYSTSINGYNITNCYTPEKLTISGSKTWDDNNDQDGKRPQSIEVVLTGTAGGETVVTGKTTVTADQNGDWKYTFKDVPKYNHGVEITYTVSETAVDNYTTTINGYDVKNVYITPTPTATPTVALASLSLQKVDRLNPSKALEGAEYTLYTEEACENVLKLNGQDAIFRTGADGKATLTGIPAGTYWVKETKAPAGYEVDPLPYKVDVVLNPETPQLVQVSDYPLRGALRLSKTVTGTSTDAAFTFDILLTGESIAASYEATLNDQAADPVSFTATENGAKATVSLKDGDTLTLSGIREGTKFTVTEQTTEGYDVTINDASATAATGTISSTTISVAKFQNKLQVTTFRVQKVWSGLDEGETAPAIQLTLYCNGEKVKATTPTPDANGWYTYTGLPAYVNGQAAVYTVKEEPVSGFTTTYINKGEYADANDSAYNGSMIKNCKIPQTGDSASPLLWVMLMLLAGSALVGITTLQKRRN